MTCNLQLLMDNAQDPMLKQAKASYLTWFTDLIFEKMGWSVKIKIKIEFHYTLFKFFCEEI